MMFAWGGGGDRTRSVPGSLIYLRRWYGQVGAGSYRVRHRVQPVPTELRVRQVQMLLSDKWYGAGA